MGRRSRRRHHRDDSLSSRSSESEASDEGAGRILQVALRDKEELLVQKALERIRRAQMLGKKNVKLTQPELDALERKRRKDQALRHPINRRTSASDVRDFVKRRGSRQTSAIPIDERPGKRSSRGYFPTYDGDSSSSSRKATPPAILASNQMGVTVASPLGYQTSYSSSQDKPLRSGSRSTSSHSMAQASPTPPRTGTSHYTSVPEDTAAPRSSLSLRRLPDDPNWEPRSRSSSTASTPYPPDPYYYQAYSPPMPQVPAQYNRTRRIVSNPQPDLQYPRIRAQPQAHTSEPFIMRRVHSDRAIPSMSGSDIGTDSDDDDDGEGVQIDVVPYGEDYRMNVRSEFSTRERPTRRQR